MIHIIKRDIVVGFNLFIAFGVLIYIAFTIYLRVHLKDNQYLHESKIKEKGVIKYLDIFLKKGGHWISLKYAITMQCTMIILAIIIGMRQRYFFKQLKFGVVFLVLFETVFLLWGFMQMKYRETKLMKDLFDIQDTLRYQSGSGVSTNDLLLQVYPKIKDKTLKEAINQVIVAFSYNQDVLIKIKEIKNVGRSNNVHAFSNILLQKYSIGDIEESVETEAQLLADFDTNRKIIKRRSKHIQLIILSLVLAVQMSILMVVPTLLEIADQFYRIIR